MIQPGIWQAVVEILTDGLKSDNACEGFCQAIERCGEILAVHFPYHPGDQDELPNRLVTEPE
jgi:putative membrane protein